VVSLTLIKVANFTSAMRRAITPIISVCGVDYSTV